MDLFSSLGAVPCVSSVGQIRLTLRMIIRMTMRMIMRMILVMKVTESKQN